MFYRFTVYPSNCMTTFGNPNTADTLVDEFYQNNRGYDYAFEQSEDGKTWFFVDLLAVKPGDRIRACGLEFEVATVLYQDHFSERVYPETALSRKVRRLSGPPTVTPAYPPSDRAIRHLFHDVEFMDNNGGYHHWKSLYDGGVIVRAEQPEKEVH